MEAGGQRWHVQLFGNGPPLLLVHGTGAATHTWRDLAPRLATRFTVIAPDLPGHGFTTAPRTDLLSLDGMAKELGVLLDALEIEPVAGVGHAAGMAVLLRLALDREVPFKTLVGINAALTPPRRQMWTLLAPGRERRLAQFVRRWPRHEDGDRLARGLAAALHRFVHVAGAGRALRRIPPLAPPHGRGDDDVRELGYGRRSSATSRGSPRRSRSRWRSTIRGSRRAAPTASPALFPRARIVEIGDCGHLAHEEKPGLVETVIVESAQREGVLPRAKRGVGTAD